MNEEGHDYCRAIEAYLCRKNDGHLIRLVGPAFERVCDWAERGVPLKVAFRGIDRYFERYYAKGPRRRPVRIEFCEADVLDVFDEWRRAVGVSVVREVRGGGLDGYGAGDRHGDDDAEAGSRFHGSLPAHLDRVLARLREAQDADAGTATIVETAIRTLEEMRVRARGLRGPARTAALDELRRLDAELLSAARAAAPDTVIRAARAEAEEELAPFRARMPAEVYQKALAACADKIIRERARLPTMSYE